MAQRAQRLTSLPPELHVIILEALPTRAVAALACTSPWCKAFVTQAWPGICAKRFASTGSELESRADRLVAAAKTIREACKGHAAGARAASLEAKASSLRGASLRSAPSRELLYMLAAGHGGDGSDDQLGQMLETLAIFDRDWPGALCYHTRFATPASLSELRSRLNVLGSVMPPDSELFVVLRCRLSARSPIWIMGDNGDPEDDGLYRWTIGDSQIPPHPQHQLKKLSDHQWGRIGAPEEVDKMCANDSKCFQFAACGVGRTLTDVLSASVWLCCDPASDHFGQLLRICSVDAGDFGGCMMHWDEECTLNGLLRRVLHVLLPEHGKSWHTSWEACDWYTEVMFAGREGFLITEV